MMRWKLRSASTGASCQSVSSMPQYSLTPPRRKTSRTAFCLSETR